MTRTFGQLSSSDRPDEPRITPLPEVGNDEYLQRMIDDARQRTGGASNIFLTLGRHPRLLGRYLPFAHQLFVVGLVPARDRELAILRTAWRCSCEYEWAQHTRIATSEGVTSDEIDRLRTVELDGWPAWERCILQATDALIVDHSLSDVDWAALAERYDMACLVEFTLLVGHYAMLAGMLNAVKVQIEPSED